MQIDLGALAANVHSQNVAIGWWDNWPNRKDRHKTAMMLVVSELAEAMEGDRKDLMDDHLTDHKMFGVELADTMIRLLDLAGAYGMTLNNVHHLRKLYISELCNLSVPEQLHGVVRRCMPTFLGDSEEDVVYQGVIAVMAVAYINGVDLWTLVRLKRAYNTERLDHKRASREADGGKKY